MPTRRFGDEANRLYGVLNNRLAERPYLAGDDYTIADMISYPWTVNWKVQGQDIEEFKYFKRWFEEIGQRPAVQRGMAVGSDLSTDVSKLPAEEQAADQKAPLQSTGHSRAVRRGPGSARARRKTARRPPSRPGALKKRQGPSLHGCDTTWLAAHDGLSHDLQG